MYNISLLLVYLIIAVLLSVFKFSVAQDPDCDYRQYVGPSERYYIINNYSPGRKCRFVATCLEGYNCKVDCNMYIPWSSGCTGDRLLISKTGDAELIDADAYCGYGTVSAVSVGTDFSLGLVIPETSNGGSIMCNLTAQMAPVTPAPAVCRCGERKQYRTVEGQETKENEYTMMAGIIETAIDSVHCGGVIISSRYIMTAAHCVDSFWNTPQNLTVAVGAHNISNHNSGKRYSISKVIIHEQYNTKTYDYDIALVELQNKIVFNDDIQPVCLPFKYVNNDLNGSVVTFLGWGTQSYGGPKSEILQVVEVTVISQNQCATTEPHITSRQICTHTPRKDACQYDSGGPALYTDPETGSLFCVGIISRGNTCAGARPGVNTRVSQLLKWIVQRTTAKFCDRR